MKSTFGKVLPILYSSVKAVAEAAGIGSSVLMVKDPGSQLTAEEITLAYTFGAITALSVFGTTYCFQGEEIRKRLSPNKHHPIDQEIELEALLGKVSNKRKIIYLTIKYGHLGTYILIKYWNMSLLYSAFKAFINDLSTGEDTPLTFVSQTEALLLLLYFSGIPLLYMWTNDIAQSLKVLRRLFRIPEKTPDQWLIDKIFRLIQPFVRNSACVNFIRIAGTINNTVLETAPLILIVPTSWIRGIAQGPVIYRWLAGIPSFSLLTVVTSTIFAQTYLFEGKFTRLNCAAIAEFFGENVGEEKPWIPVSFAKIFYYLLFLGGLIHACDIALDLSLTMREFLTPMGLIIAVSLLAGLIGWIGNHFSEVKESQDSLEKITQHPKKSKKILPVSEYNPNSFFPSKRNYGAIEVDEDVGFEKIPVCLLEYRTPTTPNG